MKKYRIVVMLLLLVIFGEILVSNFNLNTEKEYNTSTINVLEKFDGKVASKKKTTKTTKKKSSKKKSTKKKTKKKTTKKKTTSKKKTTKKTTTVKAKTYKSTRKATKRSSNAQIAELQAYAKDLVINVFHWSETDFNNLVELWNHESGWNVYASYNGCYGIPQAKPGNKMKSEGSDWKTNGKTQIRWGLNYIANRYGNPSKAWKHFQKKHWY